MIRPDTSKRLISMIADFTAGAPHHSDVHALQRLKASPGLIPALVTPDWRVFWVDVGQRRLTEWKYRDSIHSALVSRPDRELFSTSLELLAHPELDALHGAPDGFIFHMSRCGSTLLARALARAKTHNVIIEGTPLHIELWHHLTRGWQTSTRHPQQDAILRGMIGMLCRPRWPDQRNFLKFRSWNVLFVEDICRVFPGVRGLFLYRDPAEVLVSAEQSEPNYTRFQTSPAGRYLLQCAANDPDLSDPRRFRARLYRRMMAVGLASPRLTCLNYRALTLDRLEVLLQRGLGISPSEEALAEMAVQFGFYAKDNHNQQTYTADIREKRSLLTPALKRLSQEAGLPELYRRLESAPDNLSAQH